MKEKSNLLYGVTKSSLHNSPSADKLSVFFKSRIKAEGNQLFDEATTGENGNNVELSGDTNIYTVVEKCYSNELVIEQFKERILSDEKNTRNVLRDELTYYQIN
eukprot:15333943-Ditylum_brightwellii.AAC.3